MPLEPAVKEKISDLLKFIYADKIDASFVQRLFREIKAQQKSSLQRESRWDEKDVILITYGDSIKTAEEKPLETLNQFCRTYLHDVFSIIHILPFFPYSSDDGFSVIDYKHVNPELGDWSHIAKLRNNFDLMFDLVINHVSQHSEWFQNYLRGESPGVDYFIEANPLEDLSQVVRPRSLPLLTPFQTGRGKKYLWTTFSNDQIDLNFGNPKLLFEMIKVLLLYLQLGARILRLDAIAFLWKEKNTTCLHLPQAHAVVKLLRLLMHAVCPQSILLTETNVPNAENLSYFGENDEAHMVYQFSLPPLLLHALHSGNSSYLTQWAQTIPDQRPHGTYLNFTASHDGIGVRPLEGLLPKDEKKSLLEKMQEFGGRISVKNNADGSSSPYEINISLYDALKGTRHGADEFHIERFLCSQTIMMTLQGIPAFYIHSLLGTENDLESVKETGRARSINRKRWNRDELLKRLETDRDHHHIIFKELKRLIKIRREQPAFSPNAGQNVIDAGEAFFVVERRSVGDEQQILSISNLTSQLQEYEIDSTNARDLISGERCRSNTLRVKPYQTMWLAIQ